MKGCQLIRSQHIGACPGCGSKPKVAGQGVYIAAHRADVRRLVAAIQVVAQGVKAQAETPPALLCHAGLRRAGHQAQVCGLQGPALGAALVVIAVSSSTAQVEVARQSAGRSVQARVFAKLG